MTPGFIIAALLIFAASIFTVRSSKLVHAVLWLGAMLASTAVLFIQLDAPFLAGIQLLLYVGGVMTLMIFGVMLTKKSGDGELRTESAPALRGLVISLALFGLLAGGIFSMTNGAPALQKPEEVASIAASVLGEHWLAFETLSVLLLAAMVGAILLARKRDAGAPESGKASPR